MGAVSRCDVLRSRCRGGGQAGDHNQQRRRKRHDPCAVVQAIAATSVVPNWVCFDPRGVETCWVGVCQRRTSAAFPTRR
jgi:hypothetical protein